MEVLAHKLCHLLCACDVAAIVVNVLRGLDGNGHHHTRCEVELAEAGTAEVVVYVAYASVSILIALEPPLVSAKARPSELIAKVM